MPFLLNPVVGLMMIRGVVTETEPIADRMRRVRVEGDGLAGLDIRPEQQVRVLVGRCPTRRLRGGRDARGPSTGRTRRSAPLSGGDAWTVRRLAVRELGRAKPCRASGRRGPELRLSGTPCPSGRRKPAPW